MKIYLVRFHDVLTGNEEVRACSSRLAALTYARLHTAGNYYIVEQETYDYVSNAVYVEEKRKAAGEEY